MRIAYYLKAGKKTVAYYFDSYLVDVEEASKNVGAEVGEIKAEAFVMIDGEQLKRLEALYNTIKANPLLVPQIPVEQAELLPLISSDANNVFFVGRNYKSVAADMNKATNKSIQTLERPAYFVKTNRAIISSGESILASKSETSMLDYEGEIGIVIGKKGKDIPCSEAAGYIFGYTICNDVSARDTMKAYYQMFKGKSMDTFSPIGPCIATIKEILDYRDINIKTCVNGDIRQIGNTSDLIFDFPTLISILSRGITLLPGDVISTGTPAGIGAAMDPPRFLEDGDRIEITVDGVGRLENTVKFY